MSDITTKEDLLREAEAMELTVKMLLESIALKKRLASMIPDDKEQKDTDKEHLNLQGKRIRL